MPIQGLISLQTLNSMGAETVHSLITIPSLWKDVYNKRKVCHDLFYYLGTMKKSELKFFGFWELQSIIHILSNFLII